jgi:hypothetical protein
MREDECPGPSFGSPTLSGGSERYGGKKGSQKKEICRCQAQEGSEKENG